MFGMFARGFSVSISIGSLILFLMGMITTKQWDVIAWCLGGGFILTGVIAWGFNVHKEKTLREHNYRQKKSDYEELLAWAKVAHYEYRQAWRDGRTIFRKAFREGIQLDDYNIDVLASHILNDYTREEIARKCENIYWYFGVDGNAYYKFTQ